MKVFYKNVKVAFKLQSYFIYESELFKGKKKYAHVYKLK